MDTQRSTYVLLVATFAFAVAASAPWFVYPSASASTLTPIGGLNLVTASVPFEPPFRIVAALLAAALFAIAWRSTATSFRGLARLLLVFWIATAAFPYLINQWAPEAMIESRMLFKQMDLVVEDMEINMSGQQHAWRAWQQFRVKLPTEGVAGIDIPVPEKWNLGLLSWSNQFFVMAEILGFTNAFLNFAARGWVFALLAPPVGLLGLYLAKSKPCTALRRDLGFAALTLIAVGVLLLGPRAVAQAYLKSGDFAAATGDRALAIDRWRTAATWKPSLRFALWYNARIGENRARLGCNECQLALLSQVEKSRLDDIVGEHALALLERAIAARPNLPAADLWRGMIAGEAAFDAYVTGDFGLADKLWHIVLHYIPTHPFAWYGRSLVKARLGDWDGIARDLAQIADIQNYLSFWKLTIRGQMLVAEAFAAYRSGDLAVAHERFSTYLTPERW